MAKHEFGIMPNAPVKGRRYDQYEPERYGCISIDDDDLEKIVAEWEQITFCWHTVDAPGKGIAYCGITLIPPTSMPAMISGMEKISELSELRSLLQSACRNHKWVIHYGL